MSLGTERDFEEALRDEVLQAIAALRSARDNELRILELRKDVGIGTPDGDWLCVRPTGSMGGP